MRVLGLGICGANMRVKREVVVLVVVVVVVVVVLY